MGIVIALFLILSAKEKAIKEKKIIAPPISSTITITQTKNQPLEITAPKDGTVTDQKSISIKGKSEKNSLIVIQSATGEKIMKNNQIDFSLEFPLSLGENVIKITAYHNKNIDEKTLTIYSFEDDFLSSSVIAQSPATPSASLVTATPSSELNQIKILKDKIATKVAQLRRENKQVVSGYVTKKENELITVTTRDEKQYQVFVDETLTKIYRISANSKKEIKLADLEKDNFVIATGSLVEDSLNADILYQDQEYIIGLGKIADVTKSDYTIRVITAEKDEYTFDIEPYTKQQIVDVKTTSINASGFSKLKVGDTLHFAFKKAASKTNRFSALRILIIPQELFVK